MLHLSKKGSVHPMFTTFRRKMHVNLLFLSGSILTDGQDVHVEADDD